MSIHRPSVQMSMRISTITHHSSDCAWIIHTEWQSVHSCIADEYTGIPNLTWHDCCQNTLLLYGCHIGLLDGHKVLTKEYYLCHRVGSFRLLSVRLYTKHILELLQTNVHIAILCNEKNDTISKVRIITQEKCVRNHKLYLIVLVKYFNKTHHVLVLISVCYIMTNHIWNVY